MLEHLDRRIKDADPLVVDAALAVGLAVLACLSIWLFTLLAPDFAGRPFPRGDVRPFRPERAVRLAARMRPDMRDYVLAAACFLPLALRRRLPWVAFGLTGTAAVAYGLQPAPPTFTFLGPMIALFTLAATAPRRMTGLVALLVGGVVIAVPIIPFSANLIWARDLVTAFALLAASALFGEAERSRRAYVAEVEQRAREAERTREEEALRRVGEERIHIAREVHDTVAHSLTIVAVQAAAAEALLDEDPARARDSIGHVRQTAKDALADLRSVLAVLRAAESEVPLAPTANLSELDELIASARRAGLEVDVATTGDLSAVPAPVAVSVYRVVQESLTNVVRHAHATHVSVNATAGPRQLVLEIRDNGNGPDPTCKEGHGIRGMRERVAALGGQLHTGPGSLGGFTVRAEIPLTGEAS